MIDLSIISDEDLSLEYWRRAHATRQGGKGGRPKKLQPCPKCGVQMGFNELRAHQPKCEFPTEYLIPAPKSTRQKLSDVGRVYVTANGIRLVWSGSMPLPSIGSIVSLFGPHMHHPYKAEVKGYWMEAGNLGIMTKPKRPQQWFKECHADAPQWAQDGLSCQMGSDLFISKTKTRQEPKLTVDVARKAARRLMAVVISGREWDVQTAANQLPDGWDLVATDSDFHPCTITNFMATYRACAHKQKKENK